jgi:hypothetical protein
MNSVRMTALKSLTGERKLNGGREFNIVSAKARRKEERWTTAISGNS